MPEGFVGGETEEVVGSRVDVCPGFGGARLGKGVFEIGEVEDAGERRFFVGVGKGGFGGDLFLLSGFPGFGDAGLVKVA